MSNAYLTQTQMFGAMDDASRKIGSLIGSSTASFHFKYARWLRFDPTNHKGVIVKQGTTLALPNGMAKHFTNDTPIDLSSEVTTAGKDYFLFINSIGEIHAVLDKSNGTGNYIGRFHTLCANAGTMTMISPASPSSGITVGSKYLIKPYRQDRDPDFYAFYNKEVTAVSAGTPYDVITTQHPLSGYLAGDILPESVFCITFYPDTLHEDAMVYDKTSDIFVDVYLQSGTGVNTKSVYNATHTVSRQQMNHLRDFMQVGKRLLDDQEFSSIALGSNECTAIQGSADKTTVGGHVDTNSRRMISAIGCEECCGYLWQWLSDHVGCVTDSWGTRDGRGSFGQEYRDFLCLLAGGIWSSSSYCGSGSRDGSSPRSAVNAKIGGRGCVQASRSTQNGDVYSAISLNQSFVTGAVSCAVGATSCVISDARLTPNSVVDVEFENTSNTFFYLSTTLSNGQCTVTFPALTEVTKIRLYVRS